MAEISRRNVLTAGAVGVAGAALAACGSSDSASVAEQSPAQPDPAASPAIAGEPIIATADVPVGGGKIVDMGQTKIVVTQPEAGTFVGLSAVCPHQGCLCSSISDGRISCPCHGSQFAIADGAVLQGPATTGLEAVAVSVNGDQVVLD